MEQFTDRRQVISHIAANVQALTSSLILPYFFVYFLISEKVIFAHQNSL